MKDTSNHHHEHYFLPNRDYDIALEPSMLALSNLELNTVVTLLDTHGLYITQKQWKKVYQNMYFMYMNNNIQFHSLGKEFIQQHASTQNLHAPDLLLLPRNKHSYHQHNHLHDKDFVNSQPDMFIKHTQPHHHPFP